MILSPPVPPFPVGVPPSDKTPPYFLALGLEGKPPDLYGYSSGHQPPVSNTQVTKLRELPPKSNLWEEFNKLKHGQVSNHPLPRGGNRISVHLQGGRASPGEGGPDEAFVLRVQLR